MVTAGREGRARFWGNARGCSAIGWPIVGAALASWIAAAADGPELRYIAIEGLAEATSAV